MPDDDFNISPELRERLRARLVEQGVPPEKLDEAYRELLLTEVQRAAAAYVKKLNE